MCHFLLPAPILRRTFPRPFYPQERAKLRIVILRQGLIWCYLDQIIAWRGQSKVIRVDNGPEFISHVFEGWAKERGIALWHIQPGSPYQNGFVERFNRTYREDVLDLHWFNSLNELRKTTDDWMVLYNEERPHEGLGDMTPMEYATAA